MVQNSKKKIDSSKNKSSAKLGECGYHKLFEKIVKQEISNKFIFEDGTYIIWHRKGILSKLNENQQKF